MEKESLSKKYFRANIGEYPESFVFMGRTYVKKEDLRYGTNPHQKAAYYKPEEGLAVLGDYKLLKTGKGGFSQTNLEDINYAIKILKYFGNHSTVIMKHLNPCGAAIEKESLSKSYKEALLSDPKAAFGGVVVFNSEVNEKAALQIMEGVVEVVVGPSYTKEALSVLNDYKTFKRNKHLRVVEVKNLAKLPKFIGDSGDGFEEVKVLSDGTIIISQAYLTKIRSKEDLLIANTEDKDKGFIKALQEPTDIEYKDLLTSWYINLGVRSNGVVIVKNGTVLAIGTGEQDRVGAVEQAIMKAKTKYAGSESLKGAVISSDGFFPFRDSIDVIAESGIKAIVQPGGSVSDYEVIKACNEHGISMVFTDERCFSHH